MTDRVSTMPAVAGNASGWIEAGLYVLCIALLGIAYAVAARHGAHTAVFILYSLVISALALLAITGPGRNARAIMLDPGSWLIGIANMVVEGGYAMLLTYIAPASGNLLIRMSIPITLLIGVIMFGRRPKPLVWIGAAIICAVVATVLATIDGSVFGPVLASALATSITVGVRAFASEFHVWNRSAANLTEKIQVTALVTLVTAIAGLLLVGILMTLVQFRFMPSTPLLPTADALLHMPTIWLALFVGGALFTAMTYLSFSSVLKIRSENFIATSAFMPLATLCVQIPAAAIGLISLPPFDWRSMPAFLGVIAGVLLIIWGGRRTS